MNRYRMNYKLRARPLRFKLLNNSFKNVSSSASQLRLQPDLTDPNLIITPTPTPLPFSAFWNDLNVWHDSLRWNES